MGLFKVEDMSCGHCEKAIKNQLGKAGPEVKVQIDLKDKSVSVENLADDQVIHLLDKIGYTAVKVQKT